MSIEEQPSKQDKKLKDEATRAKLKYLKRVIGQALREKATPESIDAYLTAQDVTDPQKYRHVVELAPITPMLGGEELQRLGGRNVFRAQFGLDAIVPRAVEELDFALTESGDSELFAEIYSEALRYDHRQGRWLISDEESGLWLPDRVDSVLQKALDTMRERQKRSVNLEDHVLRKSMGDWSHAGESRSRLNNLVALAEHREPLYDAGDDWDQNPWLLGCKSGVIDLSTGEHRRANPEDRVTMRISVRYDPEATCPTWLEALAGIFAGHEVKAKDAGLLDSVSTDVSESQRVIDFVQRAMGYSITGDCREECCFFMWGDGRNGKGTILNTIGELLGDYTDDMPMATLEKAAFKSQSIPNDVAKLVGKRLVTCAEVNEFALNESRLKALTGRDPMTARFLNKEFFTFKPVGKIWVATNNKPKITGLDEGIWSRIHLIPFTNKFEGANNNKKLKDQLLKELPGILNWLLAGTKLWLEKGLDPPETVKVATEEYRTESDPTNPFIEACCTVAPAQRVQHGLLFKAYQSWASGQVDHPLNEKQFAKSLKRRFQVETGRHTFYLGVGMLDGRHEGLENPPF